MKKLLILIIIILIIWFVFLQGEADAPVTGDATPTPTSVLDGFDSDSESDQNDTNENEQDEGNPDGADGSDSEPTSDGTRENGVLRDAQTYVNEHENYQVDLHEWWWYERDRGSSDHISTVFFDRNEINLGSDTPGTIMIQTFNSLDAAAQLYATQSADDVTIGGVTGARASYDKILSGGQQVPTHQILFEYDGNGYAMLYYDYEDNGQYLAIFNAMVESFEFLD